MPILVFCSTSRVMGRSLSFFKRSTALSESIWRDQHNGDTTIKNVYLEYRTVIKFQVTCSLVLHTRHKLLTLWGNNFNDRQFQPMPMTKLLSLTRTIYDKNNQKDKNGQDKNDQKFNKCRWQIQKVWLFFTDKTRHSYNLVSPAYTSFKFSKFEDNDKLTEQHRSMLIKENWKEKKIIIHGKNPTWWTLLIVLSLSQDWSICTFSSEINAF